MDKSEWIRLYTMRGSESLNPSVIIDRAELLWNELEKRGYVSNSKASKNVSSSVTSSGADKGSEDRFLEFYGIYPKKKNKGQAKVAFFRLTADRQKECIEGTKLLLPSIKKQELKYVQYPSTFINSLNWERVEVSSVNDNERRLAKELETSTVQEVIKNNKLNENDISLLIDYLKQEDPLNKAITSLKFYL